MELAKISKIEVTPNGIIFDENAVKAKISDMVAPYIGVTEDEVLNMSLKDARTCRADLNAISKDLNQARKDVKAEYLRPLTVFEDKIKALDASIKEPCAVIDGVIKRQEQMQREERFNELAQMYEDMAPALAEAVPADKIVEKPWCTASYSKTKAEKELTAKVTYLARDLETLETTTLYSAKDAKRVFLDTLDISEALRHDRKLRERDEEIKRMDEMRNYVPEPAPAPSPEPAPAPAPAPETMCKTVVISGKEKLVQQVVFLAERLGLDVK